VAEVIPLDDLVEALAAVFFFAVAMPYARNLNKLKK
jgi:hypothetical protein